MSHLVSAYKLPKSHPYERPLAIINPKLSCAPTSSTACGTNRALALMRVPPLVRIPPASKAASLRCKGETSMPSRSSRTGRHDARTACRLRRLLPLQRQSRPVHHHIRSACSNLRRTAPATHAVAQLCMLFVRMVLPSGQLPGSEVAPAQTKSDRTRSRGPADQRTKSKVHD